ncbi:hypothetical protein ACFY1J_05545 [Streptomyces sp. NPDC001406]|uniref:hypothetical protein n=1 Tax=Streptomyces sp. NPDC001406 TaxID=3364572 RepID=UPI003691A5A5
MHATIRAHRARKARSPRWADRRPRPAGVRSTNPTVSAARACLARSYRYGERRSTPWLKTRVTRGETALRFGAYGRPVPFPPVDRSMLPCEERMGRPQRR